MEPVIKNRVLISKDWSLWLKYRAESATTSVTRMGIAGGYSRKLSCKSPLKSASKERWKPQPGQSKPVIHLKGQGSKKISA